MYTTSETLRLSLTMAQMLDYMTDNHINDILMFQQFLLLHTFLGVSKSLSTQSVQGPKKKLSFSIHRTKQYNWLNWHYVPTFQAADLSKREVGQMWRRAFTSLEENPRCKIFEWPGFSTARGGGSRGKKKETKLWNSLWYFLYSAGAILKMRAVKMEGKS